MLQKKLYIVACSLAISLVAISQEKDNFNPYYSIKAGVNMIDNSGASKPWNIVSENEVLAFSNPYFVGGDYRFNRLFSAGLVLSYNQWKANDDKVIDRILVTDQGSSFGTNTGDLNYFSGDVNFKFYFDELFLNSSKSTGENRDWLDAYLTAGGGVFSIDEADTGISGNLGTGLNFWFTDQIGITTEVLAKFAGDSDFAKSNHIQYLAGVSYRFGESSKKPSVEEEKPEEEDPNILDSDNDGVVDAFDRCPNTETTEVDGDGCPLPVVNPDDIDGDGIINSFDKCPEVAGTLDNSGCPKIEKDVAEDDDAMDEEDDIVAINDDIKDKIFNLSRSVKFGFDSDVITPKHKTVLDEIIELLKPYPTVNVDVLGHTDSTGSSEYNIQLSERRAQNVMNYLKTNGMESAIFKIVPKGEDDPMSTNLNRQGKYENRRIELVIQAQQ